jgi:phage terminase small subunit
MNKAEIIDHLMKRNGERDICVQYADIFLEYQEATNNISENGLIVQHPRTMNPIENPYLAIRDRATKKLQSMRRIDATGLW